MSTIDHTNTYWNGKGACQWHADELRKLIPDEGEVSDAANNPRLEKYRQAVNVYYDLYNNGLDNYRDEFRDVFGFNPATLESDADWPEPADPYHIDELRRWYDKVDKKMTIFIRLAAAEQGLGELV